jgi:ribose transport system permease protein
VRRGAQNPQPAGSRLRSAISRFAPAWILVFLLLEILFFALVLPSGTFVSVFNLKGILGDSAVVLLLATAATLVIITGGIDLSTGSLLTLAAVVGASVMSNLANDGTGLFVTIVVGAGAAIAVATAWGMLNGLVVTRLKVPSFVMTLASLGAALGVARLLAEGGGVSGYQSVPPELQDSFGQAEWLGVPAPFVLAAAVMTFFGLVLAKTRFGEHIYMMGSNEEAARRGGIKVTNRLIAVYALAGLLAGLAGVVDLARYDAASVATGHVTELIAAIAAVVIGGASLFGGRGNMVGTAIGVFIPVVLANGLLIGGIGRFWQDVIIGAMLVLAVALDQWRRDQELRRAAYD